MTRKKLNIAVTGLNAIDSPGPGVAVIRGLLEAKSFDANIVGLAYESLEPGIYMHNLVSKTYQVPYPSAGVDVLLDRLQFIHQKEHLDVIIPNFDAELYSYIKIEGELNAMGIHIFLPTMTQLEERHKINLFDFGKKYAIKVPKSKVIYEISDIYDLQKEFEMPVVVKGKFYDAGIASNIDQVKSLFKKISAKWGLPIIIQEFVQGTEFNITGLGDGKGNTIAAVPMRKQYITDKGKAWGGISIADQTMLDLTNHFIGSTKWRGGFELELMKDKNNEFNLLEINPRMPAWIYLAVGVGQNIPEALVRMALGEEVTPYTTYDIGKMFIRYAWDMIVDISEFQKISTSGEL
ncbi:MAG TPA: biotin carboxylase [Bacteroidales bacterium]|nr:MAG: biotin carboxylase [Bacteroidetes bacterium GWE2_42_24]OFY27542.1 MAG: biotin carboxylase [Bacteroidetes bacterium GWF2_43_11]PKP23804.1 MAG: biotin carboxylase [Bacteroidetes bacterium HGW-Bacteroidetes-22]HAQ64977.1 biotin carboxylase [Bacteroidales bacterium]HBZ66066.1 biotin carboxylase [Bacteroidales bacterium]